MLTGGALNVHDLVRHDYETTSRAGSFTPKEPKGPWLASSAYRGKETLMPVARRLRFLPPDTSAVVPATSYPVVEGGLEGWGARISFIPDDPVAWVDVVLYAVCAG